MVFSVVQLMHWIIPNVPKEAQEQIEREILIKQQAIWQINSKSKTSNSNKDIHRYIEAFSRARGNSPPKLLPSSDIQVDRNGFFF